MELQELREEIDRLDTVLLDTFLKRMKVSEAVAEYKMEQLTSEVSPIQFRQ